MPTPRSPSCRGAISRCTCSPRTAASSTAAASGISRTARPSSPGNESFQVGGAGDSQALALPDGSSATTAPICVGLDSPTLRFFARNDGDPDSGLRVSVIVQTLLGPLTLPIGTVDGTDSWHPTPSLLLLANLTALPIVNDGTASIRLRFPPQGSGGDWRIDDVYVDPWKGR